MLAEQIKMNYEYIPSAKTAKLIKEYTFHKTRLTEQEKAVWEQRIWFSLNTKEKTKIGGGTKRDFWLAKMLGGTSYRYRMRHFIWRANPDAQLLWGQLEQGVMPLGTAKRLLISAKNYFKANDCTMEYAIKKVVDDYNQLEIVGSSGEGNLRRRKPTQFRSDRFANKRVTKKSVWSKIRTEIEVYINNQLADADPIVARKIKTEVELDLQCILTDIQSKIARTRKAEKKLNYEKTISYKMACEACDILSMDPPLPRQKVNLKLAKKQKRLQVHLYHPDKNQGDDSLRTQYEAVIHAYELLEEYNDRFERLVLLDGGKN